MWANRAPKDLSLKARLLVERREPVPVAIFVKNDAEQMSTLYRSGVTELLIVQSAAGLPRYFLYGRGELTGWARAEPFLQSHFSYYDLGTPFLRWPEPKRIGQDRVRGQDCHVLESHANGEPYARVTMWISTEYAALLRAEAFDEQNELRKRFSITSFKRIGTVWIPHGLEMAYRPAGQTLPSPEKSRLEIYDGNYDADLPPEWFLPQRFGAVANRDGGVGPTPTPSAPSW